MTACKSNRDAGFTLLELLMVISIIAVFSALAIGVLRSAVDDAAAARTAQTLNKIKTLLRQKLEAIASRPVPFSRGSFPDGITWEQARFLKQRHLMESVRAELPAYYEMISQYPSPQSRVASGTVGLPNYWTLDNATHYRDLIRGRPVSALVAHRLNLRTTLPTEPCLPIDTKSNGPPDDDNVTASDIVPTSPLELFPLRENENALRSIPKLLQGANATLFDHALIEGAECLYSILHNTIDNGSRGTQLLAASDVGDLDGDLRPEVLDGWGQPIFFSIRVNRFDAKGDPVDRNGDGFQNYLDGQLDPNFPAPVHEYRIIVYSIRGVNY